LEPPSISLETARADPADPPEAGPVIDQWTSTTQVFRNEDGTLTAEIHAASFQAPDPGSETGWSPVSTDLETIAGTVTTENTAADIEFSSGDEGPLATVAQDGASLSVGWDGDLPAPELSGDTATYENVLPGVDATLEANPTGFEQSFVVDSAAHAPETLDFPLQLEGLVASLTDEGALVLTDESGEQIGGADPPIMWGATVDPATGEPAVQAAITTALVDTPEGLVLRLTPDPLFFSSPDVTYPVTIDPAVNLSLLLDTYVDSSNPGTSYGASTQLKAGLGGSGETYRSILRFEASSLLGTHVLSASLQLYETWSPSCTPSQVDVYSLADGIQVPVTWNNQPSIGTLVASTSDAKGYSASCPAGTVTIQTGGAGGTSLADLVQIWAWGEDVPIGFGIQAHDEMDANGRKTFKSADAATDGPVLSVTYNNQPDLPFSVSESTDGSGAITLHAGFSDPDGDSGYATFLIYNSAGTLVGSGQGTTVSSGNDSPYSVPAGLLTNWTQYTWQVRTYDGIDYSGYYASDQVGGQGTAIVLNNGVETPSPAGCTGTANNPHITGGNIKGVTQFDCNYSVYKLHTTAQLWRHRWWGYEKVGTKGDNTNYNVAHQKASAYYYACENNDWRNEGEHWSTEGGITYYAHTMNYEEIKKC
jgi:hypothetical protein